MSPRPDVSAERKDQILEAAEEVFAEKGVHAARMDDIAEKSGLSKGTLYWYFKSKDDILIAIFEQMFKQEFDELEKIAQIESSVTDRLFTITERTIIDVQRMLRLMPLAYEFISLAFRRKFVQDAFKHYINRYMEILIPILQQGIEAGEFRDTDPLEIAIAIGAVIEGTMLLWVYDKSLVNPEKHIRSGLKILLQGIIA